jgi:iron-binding CDGSH zinc finger protein
MAEEVHVHPGIPATPPTDPGPGDPAVADPGAGGRSPRRVVVVAGGPVLVEGPVQIEVKGEQSMLVERFLVAICACRRSRLYPLCDTSHRRCAPAPS